MADERNCGRRRMKCWKIIDKSKVAKQQVIHVGTNTYALQATTEEEIKEGSICQNEWCVERQYEVQVCGLDTPRPYWDKRSEQQSIPFEELIFCDGECLGIYHAECIMLFDNKKTHRQEKYLGEVPLGPESSHYEYEYYCLMEN